MAENKETAQLVAQTAVPPFVLNHAPLLHLFSTDPYRPSSIAAQIANTQPKIDFKPVDLPTSPLTLDNLNQLNNVGVNGGRDVYLTSNDDVTKNPKWLEGIVLGANGGTSDEKTGVVIVVDKGAGVVDAFYFYFFAFNWGGVVLEKQLGDHVGDWEHNMIRFINGVPKYIWYSQHANGEAFTFAAVKKDASNKRPLIYVANGSHALYPTTGPHDHTIPNLNLPIPFLLVDDTNAGPLYDPLLSSYLYAYIPSSSEPSAATGTLTPYDPATPANFLYFAGRWGDAEYPENDPRQKGKGLLSFKKYVGGPTGPLDKQLVRKEVWPESQWSKGQRIRTSLDGSTWLKDQLGKLGCFGVKARKRAKEEGREKRLAKEMRSKGVKRVAVSGEVVG